MSQITPDHLARGAYVYVRQSTPDQLLHNPESRRRQYALAERARQLGWTEVVVIDDDLAAASAGRDSSGFCWRSVRGASAPCWRLRLRGWPVMAEIGIPCWSSAPWSAAS